MIFKTPSFHFLITLLFLTLSHNNITCLSFPLTVNPFPNDNFNFHFPFRQLKSKYHLIEVIPSDYCRFLIEICLSTDSNCYKFKLTTKFPELRLQSNTHLPVKFKGMNSIEQGTASEVEISNSEYEYGLVVVDSIYISEFHIEKFPFVYISKPSDNKNYIGELGLGYLYQTTKSNVYKNKMSVIEALYENGYIDKRIFFIKLTSLHQGEFGVGNYPTEYTKDNSNIIRACKLMKYSFYSDDYSVLKEPIENEQFECRLNAVYFEHNDNDNFMFYSTRTQEAKRVLVNLSANVIFAALDFFDYMINNLFKMYIEKQICVVKKFSEFGYVTCQYEKLDEEFLNKEITFMFGKWSMKMRIKNLFYEKELFMICKREGVDRWEFGYPLFLHYIVVFDKEEGELVLIKNNLFK